MDTLITACINLKRLAIALLALIMAVPGIRHRYHGKACDLGASHGVTGSSLLQPQLF